MVNVIAFAKSEENHLTNEEERRMIEKTVIESEIKARNATIEELTKTHFQGSNERVYTNTRSAEFNHLYEKNLIKLLEKHNIELITIGKKLKRIFQYNPHRHRRIKLI